MSADTFANVANVVPTIIKLTLFSLITTALAAIAFSASAAVFRVANPNPWDGMIYEYNIIMLALFLYITYYSFLEFHL